MSRTCFSPNPEWNFHHRAPLNTAVTLHCTWEQEVRPWGERNRFPLPPLPSRIPRLVLENMVIWYFLQGRPWKRPVWQRVQMDWRRDGGTGDRGGRRGCDCTTRPSLEANRNAIRHKRAKISGKDGGDVSGRMERWEDKRGLEVEDDMCQGSEWDEAGGSLKVKGFRMS